MELKNPYYKVDIYETEVRYGCPYESYEPKDFFEMALAMYDDGYDCFSGSVMMEADKAKKVDGHFEIVNHNPFNKLMIVRWFYIDEMSLYDSEV